MRTDSDALGEFIWRCAAEDRAIFVAALADADSNGVKTVQTGPDSWCSGPAMALADLDVMVDLIWSHAPIGPGLCAQCSEQYGQPVAHPCRLVRAYAWQHWRDRPGYFHGWSPRRFTGDLKRLTDLYYLNART